GCEQSRGSSEAEQLIASQYSALQAVADGQTPRAGNFVARCHEIPRAQPRCAIRISVRIRWSVTDIPPKLRGLRLDSRVTENACFMLPMIVTHEWPGSIIEQLKMCGRRP